MNFKLKKNNSRVNHRRRKLGGAIQEVSAGGIVFKRTFKGPRLGLILDPYGKWAFAKGHVEKGETIKAAALREVREEMGLKNLRLLKPIGDIKYWFHDRYRPKTKGRLIHKVVHYFLMETPRTEHSSPQHKEKIHQVIWLPINKVKKFSGYRDIATVLEKAIEMIKAQNSKQQRKI